MGTDTSKVGPEQVVRFGIDLPSPGFLGLESRDGGDRDLEGVNLAKAMSFIWEVATDPYLDEGAFPKDRFETEREEQRRDILSMRKDRKRYATDRLVEEISKGSQRSASWESWRTCGAGHRRTWRRGRKCFHRLPSAYMHRRRSPELGISLPESASGSQRKSGGRRSDGQETSSPEPPEALIDVEDFLPGEQTQLCQAFHIGVTENHPLLPAAMVFDGILGGFPHSKLFVNIREKNSLAYFASSSLNSWRGLVLTTAGIADEVRHRVRDLVIAEV